jgi:hypothetical protein
VDLDGLCGRWGVACEEVPDGRREGLMCAFLFDELGDPWEVVRMDVAWGLCWVGRLSVVGGGW